MGKVFAYEDKINSKRVIRLADHKLSDQECFCLETESWSRFCKELESKEDLHALVFECGNGRESALEATEWKELEHEYDVFSSHEYEPVKPEKEQLPVGVFFFVREHFIFVGCPLSESETYGDFLIFKESHYDVWSNLKKLKYTKKGREAEYDYFPRGRVVYRKSDDLFIIYYDNCVKDELERITSQYSGYNYIVERDSHYCCHQCNKNYVRFFF